MCPVVLTEFSSHWLAIASMGEVSSRTGTSTSQRQLRDLLRNVFLKEPV